MTKFRDSLRTGAKARLPSRLRSEKQYGRLLECGKGARQTS